jgi:NitT/TauT family transport system permease protein
MKNFNHLSWILPTAVGAAIIAIWYAIIAIFKIPPFELPAPHQILEAGIREKDNLIPAAIRTSTSAIIGFVAAVGGGFMISLLLGSSRWVKTSLYPWILVLQMTPTIVLIPIFVIWMGPGMPSITAITFMIGFFPVVANTTMGLISTEKNLLDLFKMCNASRFQEIFLLRVPNAMPFFLTGVKIAGTLAPIGAISGDFLAGEGSRYAGLGYWTLLYQGRTQTAEMFAVAFTACILGFIFVGAVNFMHHKLLSHWHSSAGKRES